MAKGAIAPALGVAFAAAAATASCVTAPPADPPQVPALGPIIVQDAVQPPANQYLTALPPEFVVPVRVMGPTLDCRAFVDFFDNYAGTEVASTCLHDTFPALDGGLTMLSFTLTETSLHGDLSACHTITFFVADSFAQFSALTPGDSLGADSVTWQYTPNGPGNCQQFDGGDGAFPSADARMDSPKQVPE